MTDSDQPDQPAHLPRRRGRPAGTKTADREVVLVCPAACGRCKSTRHTPYRVAFKRDQAGRLVNGTRYNRIVYRDCRCLDCGKPRRERWFEQIGPAAPTSETPQP